jgi:putative FmdB family regulatory protein
VPLYDYRCKKCEHTFTLMYGSVEAMEHAAPRCPACGSDALSQLITGVSVIASEETRMDRMADPARFAGLDEDDPRAMGQAMRQMADELGEDLGPEVDEAIGRLEAGEDPASVERSMELDEGADLDL